MLTNYLVLCSFLLKLNLKYIFQNKLISLGEKHFVLNHKSITIKHLLRLDSFSEIYLDFNSKRRTHCYLQISWKTVLPKYISGFIQNQNFDTKSFIKAKLIQNKLYLTFCTQKCLQ